MEWAPYSTICDCRCHAASLLDRARFDGVSVYDPLEAATACDSCRAKHAPALLSNRNANDPEPPEPVNFCYDDTQADGEGTE